MQSGVLKLRVPDETVSVLLVLEPFFLHAYPSLVTRPREGGRFGATDGGTCLQEGVASSGACFSRTFCSGNVAKELVSWETKTMSQGWKVLEE